VAILREPKNALIKQNHKLFEFEKVKLRFTDGALSAVAREALKRKAGARGLRSILESIMLEIMYELPSQTNISECIINEEVIQNKQKPIVLYAKKAESA
jgi:ATP-dependent Clp protease ATP-binding subunit ClpX